MTRTIRLKKTEYALTKLYKLGFYGAGSEGKGENCLIVDLDVHIFISFKTDSAETPPHQPLIKLRYLEPLMILQDYEAYRLYLQEITGRVIPHAVLQHYWN